METAVIYQVVLTASDPHDWEAAQEMANELKGLYPNVQVDVFETRKFS